MLTTKQKAEFWLLDTHLSDYPENKTFDEVLELLSENDDSVTIWEPFEYWDGEYMADYLTERRRSLLRLFDDIVNG